MVNYEISVADLAAKVDPLNGSMWSCTPISKDEVWEAAKNLKTSSLNWALAQQQLPPELHRSFHIWRIAYLMGRTPASSADPIAIAILPDETVIAVDGNHRLAAAIVSGLPTLEVCVAAASEAIVTQIFPTARPLEDEAVAPDEGFAGEAEA